MADAIGSVSFHPLKPVLLSASGSRHFETHDKMAGKNSPGPLDSDSDSDSDAEDAEVKRYPLPYPLDASIKLWAFDSNQAT